MQIDKGVFFEGELWVPINVISFEGLAQLFDKYAGRVEALAKIPAGQFILRPSR